jgi:hypothetical protein
MKTVYGDWCGQLLTEAEVEGTVRLPAEPQQPWWRPDERLLTFPQIRRTSGGPIDACWRCMAERLPTVAPPRQPVAEDR